MKSKELKRKKNKTEDRITPQTKEKGMIVFGLLCIILFYPPFFRGLFFQKEILFTHIISFGLFIIYLINKITKGEKITFNNPFDYIGVFFIIAYLLPIIFKQWADLREAIGMVVRYANFFAIYLMVKDYAEEEKYKTWMMDVFILSGVGTAVIGLLGAAGYVKLQDVVLGNRISSTFQYPNTLAAFLMTLFFITTGKQIVEEKPWRKDLYASAGFIMAFTFIFTYSRTAWVLFPIFAIGYLFIIPTTAKTDTLLYYIAVALPSVLLLQPFSSYTNNLEGGSPKAVITIIAGLAIFIVLYIGLQKIKEKLLTRHLKLIYLVVGGIILSIGIFTVIALNTTRPLVFDNSNVTENTNNSIQRMIRNIEASQDYYLQVNLDAFSNEEGQWPWRIRIYGFDGEGERHTLLTRNGDPEESGDIKIPFTTHEDTERISICFENLYPGTKVTYKEAKLMTTSEEVLQNIKLGYRFIPEAIIRRLNVIDAGQRSFTTRRAYYRDSFKIFKNYPIFGAGGGAWNGLYAKYQSEPYFSTEAHNYYLQTLVELGLIGIIIVMAFLGTILVLCFMSIKKKNLIQMTILYAVLSLLVHSAFDFNFSYLSIPLFMWGLIALVDTTPLGEMNKKIKDKFSRELHSLIPLFLVVPFIIAASFFYGGHQSATSAAVALQNEGDFQKGYELMESAVARDPFNKVFRTDLARLQIMIGKENQEQAWFKAAEENLKVAIKYSPYNDNILQQTGLFYLTYGQFDQGFEYIEKMMEVAPLRPTNYEAKVNAYTTVGNHYLNIGDKDKAIEMFAKVAEVVGDVKAANEKAKRTITLNQETMNNVFKARYILENIGDEGQLAKLGDIAYISYLDIDVDRDGRLDERWRVSNREGSNIKTEIIDGGTKITNVGEEYDIFISPRFALQPSTTYGIDLKISGDVNDEHARLLVRSGNGTSTQFNKRSLGEPIENNIYSFTFETTEDIEPGAQEIRFYHYGYPDKDFIIQQIILYEIQ